MKQNYSLEIITGLFHEYFPEKDVTSYQLCSGGVENSNFLITTENGKYILKIFENSKNEIEIVQSEIGIMVDVYEMGAHVPFVYDCAKGGKIIEGPEYKPVILMECIEGKQYKNVCLGNDEFFQVGKYIAYLHDFLAILSQKYNVPETHKFDFKYVIQNKNLRNIRDSQMDEKLLENVWNEIDSMSDEFLDLDQQIIHNDLNSGNIIFQDETKPYFIDFSDIVVSSRIQDIAISLVSFCFAKHWYPDGVQYFLNGYQSVHALSDVEKNCLFACIEIRMLNIIFIPFLDTGMGNHEEFLEVMVQYLGYLKRFHEFGKENFMKYIP